MAEYCGCEKCSEKLRELEERLSRLEIERDAAIEEKEALVTENAELESKVRDLKRKIKSLEEQVAEQKKHLQQYHLKNTEMTQELILLKKRVAALEKGSATLYVAQAASLFQQAVCREVLPETFKGDRFATINKLVSYLKGEKKLPIDVNDDLGTARSKWEDIRRKLEWTQWDDGDWEFNSLPNDLKAIILLKQIRVDPAHPPTIELKEAMKYVSQVEVRKSARQYIRTFIGTMEEKMRRCGLSHEGIEELSESSSNEEILPLDVNLQ